MNKNVLVLGGTVFLSECIVKHLCRQGYLVDILTRGRNLLNNRLINEHIICDRKDSVSLEECLKNKAYEYILDISVRNSIDIENIIRNMNIKKLKKYIICSTASIFEPSSTGVIDEDSKYNLCNEYVKGKYEAEQFLKEQNLPYVIIRPTYIIGENNNLKRESILINAIINEIPIYIKDKNIMFNPIYVEDLSMIFIEIMVSEIKNVDILVGGKDIITYRQFINICEQICNKKAIITEVKDAECLKMPFLNMSVIVKNSKVIDNYKCSDIENVMKNIYCSIIADTEEYIEINV